MDRTLDELRSAISGRYEVAGEIGAGGMATVFLARDVRHDRSVAIKVLDPALAALQGKERFHREIRLAAGLSHPHILPILDSGEFGTDSEHVWYATPFVEDESLRDRLEKEKQLPVTDAIRIVAEAADALDYAHRQGVVHRDVKPDNVLLQDGHALLADFGVALPVRDGSESRLTRTGVSVGTPHYMSPEQATGADVDHRSDIYSLGCVLYESLVGIPPFSGATPVAIMAQSLAHEPPDVGRQRPAARHVQGVLARALARLPADRYQSAGELADALRLLITAPVQRAPAPPGGARRPRWRIASVALLALAAIGSLFLWLGPAGLASPGREAGVAVLPFRAIGPDAAAIVDGITLSTRDRLAAIEGIAVVGTTSSSVDRLRSMTPDDVARELGTDYVLRATVELNPSSGSVEVRPTLFGANGTQIDFWSGGSITASADTPGRVEATIASDVARALDRTIGQAARGNLTTPLNSPVAYGLYLRGLGVGGAERQARMEEALAIDSTLAPARAALASQAFSRVLTTYSAEDSTTLLEHATAAIRHAPAFAGGYTYMGLYHRSITLRADSAIAYLERARALAPGDATIRHFMASVLWSAGQLDEALVEARRGAGLDPLNSSATSRVSRILLWQHSLDEAWSLHVETARRNPSGWIQADGPLILAAMGRADSARAHLSSIPDDSRRRTAAAFLNDITWQEWLLEAPLQATVCRDRGSAVRSGYAYVDFHRQTGCALSAWRRGDRSTAAAIADSVHSALEPLAARGTRNRRVYMGLAYAHFFMGNPAEATRFAESALELLPTYWDYYPGAFNSVMYVQLMAMMGDVERLVPQLERMLNGHSPITRDWVRVDPAFEGVRGDERFAALVGT